MIKYTFCVAKNIKQQSLKLICQDDLNLVPQWKQQGIKIKRDFIFSDFKQAFSFMNNLAIISDKADHHPEWFNVFNTVKVELSTHDSKGITMKDIYLAKAFDSVYQQMKNNQFQVSGLCDISYLDKI